MSVSVIFLILAILFNAGANIMMKAGVTKDPVKIEEGVLNFIFSYLNNWQLMTGLAFFGIALVFYTKALEKFNLSIAYPLMTSCGLIIVTLWSIFVFHERLSIVQTGGIFMIIGGIWMLNIS
ncbi:MAG TPA: SMR family transporter [bacterium]|jgi:multidrug transporter EmrE-like cation transporter|nr:EamA family transporter [bacterium]MDX9804724.1 SMR family transporter [bacterium]HNW15091.1 SMR family transporter [bacterium]HNZ52849.1 SMR family transporter [bacterium]HOG42954.1 SMR family transporter [bacterium]